MVINEDLSRQIAEDMGAIPKACYINVYRTLIANELIQCDINWVPNEHGVPSDKISTDVKGTSKTDELLELEGLKVCLGFLVMNEVMYRHQWLSYEEGEKEIILDPTIAGLIPLLKSDPRLKNFGWSAYKTLSPEEYSESLLEFGTMGMKGAFEEELDFVIEKNREGFQFCREDFE